MLGAEEQKRLFHPSQSGGVDILIVTTTTASQREHWEKRLESLRGLAFPKEATLIVIDEDWKNGAGSGLGTLYAFQKAQQTTSLDLINKLHEGASIIIYHTAGKGTRLAPLTLSEHLNKSAVRVGSGMPLLEAVIRQSALLAPTYKGRLLVLWGDQLFFPSHSLPSPTHAIEVFAQSHSLPNATTWREKQLSHYGIISQGRHLDKLTYPSFHHLVGKNPFHLSLGSFSLSPAILTTLLNAFKTDLSQKKGKKDIESEMWMPLTLDFETYHSLYPSASQENTERLRHAAKGLQEPLYRCVDIGLKGIWWDFGNLRAFTENHLKLLQKTPESHLLRQFFGLSEAITKSDSLLIDVQADSLDLKNCVIFGGRFSSLKAENSLLYNVQENNPLDLPSETVRADVVLPNSQERLKFTTQLSRCSKADWNTKLPSNPCAYSALSF